MRLATHFKEVLPTVILCAALCFLGQAEVMAAAGGPRFSFHKGEKLTYEMDLHTLSHGGGIPGGRQDISGEAVLRVLNVETDGTAEIELLTRGKGRVTFGTETIQPIEIKQGEPSHIVLIVKPDGSIAQFRDTGGNPTAAVMRPGFNMLNGGDVVQAYIVGTYTLFGLLLPSRLPAREGKWTGYRKEEFSSLPNMSHVQLKKVPATYTFTGAREYKGRNRVVISGSVPNVGMENGLPTRFYFDSAKGQLVGREARVKRFGRQQADVEWITTLIKVEQVEFEGK